MGLVLLDSWEWESKYSSHPYSPSFSDQASFLNPSVDLTFLGSRAFHGSLGLMGSIINFIFSMASLLAAGFTLTPLMLAVLEMLTFQAQVLTQLVYLLYNVLPPQFPPLLPPSPHHCHGLHSFFKVQLRTHTVSDSLAPVQGQVFVPDCRLLQPWLYH